MVLLDSKKRLETFLVKLLWAAFDSISDRYNPLRALKPGPLN